MDFEFNYKEVSVMSKITDYAFLFESMFGTKKQMQSEALNYHR